MSESDTSSVTNASESTIETFEFDKVLKSLELAVEDINESKDYLSYSTLLDIYLSDPYKYSYEEREELLEHLLTILTNNTELTYEIGWDLPNLLILYVDLNFQFDGSIRSSPNVYKVLKIFECLALNGNPKELFLKSCELLNDIKVSDNNTTDNIEFKEKFFEIKLYCIFELIDSCLKKIKTFYPSRFLSMTISSFLNLTQANMGTSSYNHFILKRAYVFARSYSTPPFPDKFDDLTKEEVDKIKADEDYLQRKLLTGFLTEVASLVGKNSSLDYSMDILSYFQELKKTPSGKAFAYRADSTLMDRCTELALSFDIDLSKIFKQYIVDSHKIFHSFDYTTDQDELSGEIFERVIVDYQENVSNFIVDNNVKELNNSVNGCLILYTHSIASKRLYDRVDLTFKDALVLTLRSVIPSLIHPSFKSRGIADVCLFWSWLAIHKLTINNKKIELEITKIPSTLLSIYYQALLFICTTLPSASNFRYGTLTLLTKVLTLSPEDISFSFIKDSLMNCPYDNVKAVLIGVLKELLTKVKPTSLTENMMNLNIKDTSKSAPILPSRDVSKNSNKFLTLNKEKADDIFELIDEAIELTFVEDPESGDTVSIELNQSKFSTLSAYLNLLVVLKDDPAIKTDPSRIDKILELMDENISQIKQNRKPESDADKAELNAVDILNITLDRIRA